MFEIEVDSIRVSKPQVVKLNYRKVEDRELFSDIGMEGLVNPIMVKLGKDGRSVKLIDGARRLAVYSLLGRKTIPAVYL
jgi:ParB-like chromosome segregation protein Spo0J